MIPALLIWLYKKYAVPALSKRGKKDTILSVGLILFSSLTYAQQNTFIYEVLHKGNVIGEMTFLKKVNGSDTFLKMNSSVKTRFVFGINVQTIDQSHFKNGKLISSNVYRNVNGKEKENKKTTWSDQNYQTQSGSKTKVINSTINYNMMLLYCREPVDILQVYSDNFQQFVPIRKIASHTYRIDLPDGNHNDYHFQNGICKLVVVHHSLYTIKMQMV